MKTLYTKGYLNSMLIFVKVQNCVKWQTDTCSSVQNAQTSCRFLPAAEAPQILYMAKDHWVSVSVTAFADGNREEQNIFHKILRPQDFFM